jgi:integration host factor subunit alpha
MTLTKADIIDSLYTSTDLTKAQSAELVNSLIEIMKRTLENGEDILITGFGKFCVKDKRQRKGRDPQTGRDLELDARRVVRFRCSGRLRDTINGTG